MDTTTKVDPSLAIHRRKKNTGLSSFQILNKSSKTTRAVSMLRDQSPRSNKRAIATNTTQMQEDTQMEITSQEEKLKDQQ